MQDKPLAKRTILLTRPGGISEQLKRNIIDAGGRALHLPSLEIHAVTEPGVVKQLLAGLTAFDILVFVSTNAVKYACELFPEIVSKANDKIIFAIGSGTNEELQTAGFIEVIYTNSNTGSEALLALDELQQKNILNRKIMIMRGEGGRELLGETLLARGAEIQYVELYSRAKPQLEPVIISDMWLIERPDAVVVTSADGLRNLLEMTTGRERSKFLNTRLVVISQRLKSIAESLGFNAAIKVAMGYSDDDFVTALRDLFEASDDER